MPNTTGPGQPGAPPSLFVSVRTFWRVLLANLHSRLDLLTLELGEEAFRILYLVIAVAIALLTLHCALLFAVLLLLAAVWDTPYCLWVIGGISLAYLIAGIVSLLVARNMVVGRPKFLGQTLDELRRDVENLQAAIKPKETKP
jgi:uncharacterized membrane protein YqjE